MTDTRKLAEAMEIWREACEASSESFCAAGEQPNGPEGERQYVIACQAAAQVIATALAERKALLDFAKINHATEIMSQALYNFSGRMRMAGVFAVGSELTDANAASYERVVAAWQKLRDAIEQKELPTWDHYAEEHAQSNGVELVDALDKRAFVMSEPHLSGHRVCIGFESSDDAFAAHMAISKVLLHPQPWEARAALQEQPK